MTDLLAKRAHVTLKLATSLDGRIATRTGASQWITGPQSRAKVHEMRARHDCILTGIGTVLADNPLMTARTSPPVARQPLRAVLDTHLRTPQSSKLLLSANEGAICLFHDHQQQPMDVPENVRQIGVLAHHSGLDLPHVLTFLHDEMAIETIMVEAGSRVAGAFLRAGLVDRLIWFRAPIILGGDGLSVFHTLGVDDLSQAIICAQESMVPCGDDVMETYALKSAH